MKPRFVVRTLVAALCVTVLAGAAFAKPKTLLLVGLRADLATRSAELTVTDPISLARSRVIRAALKNIDKDKSKSLADDIGTFKKVASKIELAYQANDPILITSLNGFIAEVQTDLAAAETGANAIFDVATRQSVERLLVTARTNMALTVTPPAGADFAATRALTLRAASKAVDAAAKKIAKPEACVRGGGWFSTIGTTAFEPKFAAGSMRGTSFTAPFEFFAVDAYHYDKDNPADPYAPGAVYIGFYGTDFHGVGDYALGGVNPPCSLDYRVNGVSHTATSGTVHVTLWDPVKKDIRGSVEATLTAFGQPGEPTTTLSDGRFRACRWRLTQ